MKRIYTLTETIMSNSHNAPYTEELGAHWPRGQQFKLLPKYQQTYSKCIALEQIGGEEVILLIPEGKFDSLFV